MKWRISKKDGGEFRGKKKKARVASRERRPRKQRDAARQPAAEVFAGEPTDRPIDLPTDRPTDLPTAQNNKTYRAGRVQEMSMPPSAPAATELPSGDQRTQLMDSSWPVSV